MQAFVSIRRLMYHDGGHPLLTQRMHSWERFQSARRLLQPTWLASLIVVGICTALLIPQGRDAALYVAEAGPLAPQSLSLPVAVLILAGCGWYFPRALLYVNYWNSPPHEPWHAGLRRYYPRLLGTAPVFFLALAFALEGRGLYALLYLLTTVAFFAMVVRRRRWFGLAGITTSRAMPDDTLTVLVVILTSSYLLLAAFLLSRVWLPQHMGSIAIAMLAASSWIAFGSLVLIYPTYRFRLPSLVLVTILLTGLFSAWNDNHALRLSETGTVWSRPTPQQYFEDWWGERARSGSQRVIVIAADGGGIRAAYWTASVLARLEEEHPGLGCQVFAISSISGSSLGATVYAGLLAELDNACGTDARSMLPKVRGFLGRDFLAPALAGLFFPDLLQRFLPVAVFPDRAVYLEEAWETPWLEASAQWAEDFATLWGNDRALRVPALFFNGTWVNDGGRTAVSNLQLSKHDESLTGLDDLLDLTPGRIPASTAAHTSARFPYISPAGTILSEPPRYVVDGGYYENSGALTATQVLNLIDRNCRRLDSCNPEDMELVALVISNDPAYPGGCTSYYDADKTVDPAFMDMFVPPLTFWRTRSARGHDAECELRYRVRQLGGRYERISLSETGTAAIRPSAPLGWLLSNDTRRGIDERVDALVVPESLQRD